MINGNIVVFLPEHVRLFELSAYPLVQEQMKLPFLFVQICEQFPLLVAHSLISAVGVSNILMHSVSHWTHHPPMHVMLFEFSK